MNECNADILISAIKKFAEKPENLENFKYYLERHFSEWMDKFAYDPEGLSCEFRDFANMEI